jgi:predicted O-methyltransferase YrrM
MGDSPLIRIPGKIRRENLEGFSPKIWIQDIEGEIFQSFIKLLNIKYCFESGTANGYSTCWLAMFSEEKVYTFDVEDKRKIWEELSFDIDEKTINKIKFHKGEFGNSVGKVLQNCKGPKFFFIDGNHSIKSLEKDWKAIKEYIQNGDVVAFHDTEAEHIMKFCDGIKGFSGDFTFHTKRGMRIFVF